MMNLTFKIKYLLKKNTMDRKLKIIGEVTITLIGIMVGILVVGSCLILLFGAVSSMF